MSDTPTTARAAGAGREAIQTCLTVCARSAALFLGLFGLLNGLGELLRPGFDATVWWLDVRPRGVLGALVSWVGSACLAGYGLLPRMGRLRRRIPSAQRPACC
jgi:hypothetical protein